MNGVEKDRNLRAFTWGRKYYEDPQFIEGQIVPSDAAKPSGRTRVERLRDYQNEAYARKYEEFVNTIDEPRLREVVARFLYKLMAYKDEYEVARLLTDPAFERNVREMWEAPESISYNLHPPLLRQFGLNKKVNLGPWFRYPLLTLARFKFLRGTPFDLFGFAAHRRKERELINWYRSLIETVLERLTPDNLDVALEIASLPDQIRGYERIKEESIAKVRKLAKEKLEAMQYASVTAST